MLSWRARRQLVTVLIIVSVLGIIGFWFGARLLPEPTCIDNRKNQGELEVDCGGPCAPCELRNPQPLKIFWARAVPLRPGFYDVAAEIENKNEALSSPNLSYEFTLFDNLGPVAVKQGATFIFPTELMHVVETNLETSRIPTRVEFKVTGVELQYRKEATPNFVIERRDYIEEDMDGKKRGTVEASIVNRAPYDFKEIEVVFLALDEERNLLGVNKVTVEHFLSGERKIVKSIWPEKLEGSVAKIEVEPRVNLFDPTVILKPQ